MCMFDWIGSLRIREQSAQKVVLGLSRSTQLAGWALLVFGCYGALKLWPLSPWLAVGPLLIVILGILLVSLQRDITVDREAGVLRVDQRASRSIPACGNSLQPLGHHLRP